MSVWILGMKSYYLHANNCPPSVLLSSHCFGCCAFQQLPDKGWRAQWLKHSDSKSKDEYNGIHVNNVNNKIKNQWILLLLDLYF